MHSIIATNNNHENNNASYWNQFGYEGCKASAGIRGYPVIRFAGNDGARFAAKNCWANAQRLWVPDQLCEKRLSYWECRYLIPHAWVTIRGKVVDVTAEAYERWCRRHKIAAKGTTTAGA
jgi:hypothetical protein